MGVAHLSFFWLCILAQNARAFSGALGILSPSPLSAFDSQSAYTFDATLLENRIDHRHY